MVSNTLSEAFKLGSIQGPKDCAVLRAFRFVSVGEWLPMFSHRVIAAVAIIPLVVIVLGHARNDSHDAPRIYGSFALTKA